MKPQKHLFAFILACLMAFPVLADSPITSTPFSKVYEGESIVAYAKETGKVDKKIFKFLSSKKSNPAVKAAVCNALGWSTEGKNNAGRFLEFMADKYKFEVGQPDMTNWTADELMVHGYLTILDDYFNPGPAVRILRLAVAKNKTSYTINMIYALAKAQSALNDDWCTVWTVVNKVNNDSNLKKDMKDDAIKIILEYMRLYKAEC